MGSRSESIRLTRDEEHELAVLAKSGDASARERLILSQIDWAAKIALGYARKNPQFSGDDLMQVAHIGLIRAVDGFDPHCGHRLSTYASYAIRREVGEHVGRDGIIRLPSNLNGGALEKRSAKTQELVANVRRGVVSIDAEVDDGATLAGLIEDYRGQDTGERDRERIRRRMRNAVAMLPKQHRTVMRLRLKGLTHRQIGERMGISRARVQQVIAKAENLLPGLYAKATSNRNREKIQKLLRECRRALRWWCVPKPDIIDLYFRDVQRVYKRCSAEQAIVLWKLSRKSKRALHRLVERHLPLIVHFAKRCRGKGVPFEDLIQIGNTAIFKAIQTFDPEKGKFATHLRHIALDAMWAEIRERGTAIRFPLKGHFSHGARLVSKVVSLDALVEKHDVPMPNEVDQHESVSAGDVRDALGKIPERHRELLTKRLSGQQQKDIADEWGVTPQTIRYQEKSALQKVASQFGVDLFGQSLCEVGAVKTEVVKSHSEIITFDGESLTLSQWGRRRSISPGAIKYRLKQGWSVEKALMTPSRRAN